MPPMVCHGALSVVWYMMVYDDGLVVAGRVYYGKVSVVLKLIKQS